MIDYIRKRIKDKKVLILGFGREGKSTLKLFLEAGGAKELAIGDLKEFSLKDLEYLQEDAAEVQAAGFEEINFICGPDYQKTMDDYDIVMKSPGIVLEKPVGEYKSEILSQMQLIFEIYRDRIIGITGTKGKSTTTTLLYHILEEGRIPAVLAGNIGIPVFDIVHEIEKDSLLILELSCHQLEYMTVSPKRGVLLNIYEEHLDHYGTMEKYVASKEKIYVNQQDGDLLYVHPSVAPAENRHRGTCVFVEAETKEDAERKKDVSDREVDTTQKADVVLKGTKISYGDRSFEIPTEKISLLGAHNYLDIAFVYGICCDLGIGDEQFEKGLISYVPLPHRLQYIGTVDGVAYYDDSISTIDETTIQALNTIGNADTVLIGGMDRDISYVNLEEYLASSKVAHIILMEATGKRIYREIMENMPDFEGKERLYVVEHLQEAVALAKEITKKGGSCILSPAAASYGIFKDFEKRGDCFKKLVLEEK
ncbi:MAG: UDP-N-acetylmuramoyl-L-alanine--D-glutamate ligase [Lachnospiraceae bacterium]|nr:UDP-N-acetylmuramoyl-L-alanine--D-glutamate ligase [Lachnospiraceae bacterium]